MSLFGSGSKKLSYREKVLVAEALRDFAQDVRDYHTMAKYKAWLKKQRHHLGRDDDGRWTIVKRVGEWLNHTFLMRRLGPDGYASWREASYRKPRTYRPPTIGSSGWRINNKGELY